ncbi:MAG TPA: septum formation initiator family protein, partial [Pilimelia sp.]|nr:septum formation initiator family protein [Pilimelia sp.]
IATLAADEADQRARIQTLRDEVEKWQDPEYVKIQARKRFYYVPPGETPLIVWDSESDPGDPAGVPSKPAAPAPPWFDTLWSSVRAADKQTRS